MKTNILKYSLLTAIVLTVFTSCVGEDDYVIPTYNRMLLLETFETLPHGGGANELPVVLEDWVNVNIGTGTRLWHVRQFSGNKFAEFSSNFSNEGDLDENWLITPEVSITRPTLLRFSTEVRFFDQNTLSVWVSMDYDGTAEGITTANWIELDAFISGASENFNDTFTESGDIDLSDFIDSDIRVGFKYMGNKSAGQTSTYRLDNITIFEN